MVRTTQKHNPDLVVTRHQYGISAFVAQALFCGETSGVGAKCQRSFLGTLTASENHCLIITGMMTIDILVNSLCFLLMKYRYMKVKSVLHKLALTKLGNKEFICLRISDG